MFSYSVIIIAVVLVSVGILLLVEPTMALCQCDNLGKRTFHIEQ